MTTPALDDINMWHPDTMLPVAAGLRYISDSLELQATSMLKALNDLSDNEWSGRSRHAADMRADRENLWLRNVAGKFDDTATAIEKGAENIRNQIAFLDGIQKEASAAGYKLISSSDPAWLLELKDRTKKEKKAGAETRHWYEKRLVNQADDVLTAINSTARALKTNLTELGKLTPGNLGISGPAGERDAGMAKDGWTPEEVAKVGGHLAGISLTKAQIDALSRGEHVDLPPGVQQYLLKLMNGMSKDEFLDLSQKMQDSKDPNAKEWLKGLGNGINLLSNENAGSAGVVGGYDRLPEWYRDWASVHQYVLGRWLLGEKNFKKVVSDDDKLTAIIGASTVPTGEILGTKLIVKAAGIEDHRIENAKHRANVYDKVLGFPIPHNTATADPFLRVGALNHDSATAILTGTGGEDVGLPKDYRRDGTLKTLFTKEWDDDGKVASGLINWIDNEGLSKDPALVSRADRAFSGFYDYATHSDNFDSLMDIDGEEAVGKRNPYIADAMREAARPYHNIMAGGSAEKYGHPGLHLTNEGGSEHRASRIYALIASDENSAVRLYQDINAQVNQNAINAVTNSDGVGSGRGLSDLELGETSAAIQGLAREGILYAAADEQNFSVEGDPDRAKKVFESVLSGVGMLPGGGMITGVAGILAPWIPDNEVPETTTTRPVVGSGLKILGFDIPAAREVEWSYTMLAASGSVDTLPPGWVGTDGKLKSLPELIDTVNGSHAVVDKTRAMDTRAQIDEVLRARGLGKDLDNFNKGRIEGRIRIGEADSRGQLPEG